MSSTISDPVQTTDSPLRSLGNFIADEPPIETPTSLLAASPAHESSEDDAAEASQSPPISSKKKAAGTSQTPTAAARAQQYLKREHDRRVRVGEIARLGHRKQIERLVEEIDHLRLHVHMQDEALSGLHKRALQKDNAAAKDKKELDNRLWSMENKMRRDSVTQADDIKRSILAMASFDSELDERTRYLEKVGKEDAWQHRCDRNNVLKMKLKMDEIEKEFEESKKTMAQTMKILDETKEKVKALSDVRDDVGAMPPGSEVPFDREWKSNFDGDAEWNDVVVEAPSPGKRKLEACAHVQTKGCPQLEHLDEDESPMKRRRSLEGKSYAAPYLV